SDVCSSDLGENDGSSARASPYANTEFSSLDRRLNRNVERLDVPRSVDVKIKSSIQDRLPLTIYLCLNFQITRYVSCRIRVCVPVEENHSCANRLWLRALHINI